MDVDEPAAISADSQALVDELGQVLEAVAAQGTNVRLLRRQVDLMVQLGMVDEAVDAANTASDLCFLGEKRWLELLDAKISSAGRLNLDALVGILELFETAEKEYLSAKILTRHLAFITSLTQDKDLDEEVAEFLTPDNVRGILKAVVTLGNGLLSESSAIWQLWIDWELALFDASEGAERQQQMDHIHELYLERLQTPHTDIDTTSGAYSTWCSANCPDEYEQRLVSVTELSQGARIRLFEEKRHGKMRNDFEEQLSYSPDVQHQAQVLLAYVDWETDPLAKKQSKGRRGPRKDVGLTRAVFERTVLVYGNAASLAEEASFLDESATASMMETVAAYKTAEAQVWGRYIDWMVGTSSDEDGIDLELLGGRATRACWGSGELWRRLLDRQEEGNDTTGMDRTIEKAKALLTENEQPVAPLVEVLVSYASVLHRRYRELEATLEHPLFSNISESIQLVVKTHKAGDPSLRLEKFFVGWAEAVAPELLAGVLAMIEAPIKSRVASYQMALLRADAQARQGEVEDARDTFLHAIQRSDLDWPEAVYEAFIQFENIHGTLETTLAARKRIDQELQKVNRRRQKAAQLQEAAIAEQYQQAAEAQAAATASMEVEPAEAVPAADDAEDNAAEPAPTAEEPEEFQLKRDRENTTLLVTGLATGTEEARVSSFFESCGKIREITMMPGDEFDAALVEFRFADAVPAALDKDRKKIGGNEIRIVMLWRSTLYVTNFSKNADDAALRKMFSQYGNILQTRWPSRKYSDTRRFCYITMETPAAAQEALVLNNFKNDEGFGMKVLISDPSAKTKRSDASDTTLFVGGLNAKSRENDIRKILHTYGTITNVKLGWDKAKSICKGFAFVDMSTAAEAKAALAADGTSYHGKGLKVVMADRNHANKKPETRPPGPVGARAAAEKRARQVQLYDLPEGTQEGLLQQELEKIMPVKRLEIFASSKEAVVELESQNDAGLLLMRTEPFIFNGATIRIGERAPRNRPVAPAAAAAQAAPLPTSSLAFAPRARKPAKALPSAYHVPKAAAATAAIAAEAPIPQSGATGQDAFRAFMTATNEKRRDNLDEKIAGTKSGADEQGEASAATPAESPDGKVAGTKRDAEGEGEGSEAKRAKKE